MPNPIINGPEWDEERGEWHYSVINPEEEENTSYGIAIAEAGSKATWEVWVGDREDPDNVLVGKSHAINIDNAQDEKKLVAYLEETFDRSMEWFKDFILHFRRFHDQATSKLRKKQNEALIANPDNQEIPNSPYVLTPEGFVHIGEHGNRWHVSNFTAKIVRDVRVDDLSGGEKPRFFEIEARLMGETIGPFSVPAASFEWLGWVPNELGALASLEPKPKAKQHTTRAIRANSRDVATVLAFGHTGWREINGRYAYIHADGAIFGWSGECAGEECRGCQDCQNVEVRVVLDRPLTKRVLPSVARNDQLREAVRSTFDLWALTADEYIIPVDAAAKRAVLGEVDFALHITGPTGEGKTSLAWLASNYFGAGLGKQGNTSYLSTEHSLEKFTHPLKNQAVVLDNYLGDGEPEHKRLFIRGVYGAGDGQGRDRLTRPGKPPRTLIVSTGEDVPIERESLVGRVLIIDIPKGGGVDTNNEKIDKPLDLCQDAARKGAYAQAMAGFISWLAHEHESEDLDEGKSRYAALQADLQAERARHAAEFRSSGHHQRTPWIYADLMVGLKCWLEYAYDIQALSAEERDAFYARGQTALQKIASVQSEFQGQADPATRFAELLREALSTGKAHLGKEGPGSKIGYRLDDGLYLFPQASLSVAKALAQDASEPFVHTDRALNKLLLDEGYVLSTDKDKARGSIPIRKKIGEETGTFLHLKKDYL